MRLSQGATSTLALVSLVVSLGCAMFCAYVLWLEPERLKAQQRLTDSNLEVAKATIQLTEWLDARERRMEEAGKRVTP